MKLSAKQFQLNYLLLVSIFFVPFAIRISIFVFLSWFLLIPFNSEKENPLKSTLKNWLWISLFFIVWQCIGFIYTSNIANGLFNLQQKLAMLIVPLGIASVKKESLPRFSEITWFLTAGLAVYTCVHLFSALQVVAATSDLNALNYTRLSPDIHPTYASAYLCLGVLLLIFQLPTLKLWKTKLLASSAILLFCSFLFLLQSKAGMLTSLICFLLAIAWLIKQKVMRLHGLLLILLIVCSIWMTQHFFLSRNSERLIQAKENIFSNNTHIADKAVEESSNVRIHVWRISVELAIHSFLGTGAGDVNDDLKKAYKENDLDFAVNKSLNAHNQYIQIWLGGGYIGLILFLLWLIVPSIMAYQTKNILALLLILMLALHFLTESMFESQSGLNFFPMMIVLILLAPNKILKQRI